MRISIKNINQISNIKINRSNLKKTSLLNNLHGGSIRNTVETMIIPGGLNKWEKLYHAATGKYPESVTSRWFEKDKVGNIIQEGDYEIKIGDHLNGDPDFQLHPVSPEDYTTFDDGIDDISTDTNSNESFFDKLLDIITGGDD